MPSHRNRAAARSEGPNCAAGILEGPEFRLVWCNRLAYSLFDKPWRSDSAIGRPLEHLNPILFAAQGASLRRAMSEGEAQFGTDRMFSVERGITAFHWALHPLSPERVLALVQIERSNP